jgi:hypothetical protein
MAFRAVEGVAAEQSLQSAGFDRLDEVVAEVGFLCPAPVFRAAVAGEGDEQHLAQPWDLPQSVGHVEAAHLGHGEVKEDDLRPESPGGLQGAGSIVSDLSVVPPQIEEQGEAVGGVPVVVHDQHAAAG